MESSSLFSKISIFPGLFRHERRSLCDTSWKNKRKRKTITRNDLYKDIMGWDLINGACFSACMLLLLLLSLFSRVWLYDPMDCSPPGFSVHGILQARILEGVVKLSSRGSSDPGIKSASLAPAGRFFTTSATWPSEPPRKEKQWKGNHCHAQLFATLWTITPRLLSPWNSPGKNTGVGYHSLL